MQGRIITLLSDLSNRDPYVASLKGYICTQAPDARIVDLSHDIEKFNFYHAAFLLKNSFYEFPLNTVHIMGVQSGIQQNTPYLAAKYNGHYFLGADNGQFSLVFDNEPELLVNIDAQEECIKSTFAIKKVLAPAACFLAKGGDIQVLGETVENYRKMMLLQSNSTLKTIKASVVYVDSFGNLMLNVRFEDIEERLAVGSIHISVNRKFNVKEISLNYSSAQEGDILVVLNSFGYLEVAMCNGNAARLLGLNVNDTVFIDFQ